MPDLNAYGEMLADQWRLKAFEQSIRAAVKPGDVVLELGTATGLMAFWAAQAGARHVHAVEPDVTIALARQSARDNGLDERITFHQTVSSRLTLPERADVLIEDMRGAMPCYKTHLLDVLDAQARLLTPDASFICQRDTLLITVAEAEKQSRCVHAPWDGSRWGLDLGAVRRLAPNCYVRHRCAPDELLAEPRAWAEIHYPTVSSPHVRGGAELTVARAGTAHGLAMWFDAELFGGFRFSNAPTEPKHTYGSAFLPWPAPTPLLACDRITVKLDAVFTGTDYEWNWASTVWREGQAAPIAQFKQSTFQGRPITPQSLAKKTGDFRPRRSDDAEKQRFLLERMDGTTTNAELAAAMRAAFPQAFPTETAALARVVKWVEKLAAD
jgi:protein arginine N-methyltransferase 1